MDRIMITTSINNIIPKSFQMLTAWAITMVLEVALMVTNNRGIIIGKLSTGINIWLLLPLEAIADTIVKAAEKPKLPSSTANPNCILSVAILPINRLYSPQPKKLRNIMSMALYIILERITACGLAN